MYKRLKKLIAINRIEEVINSILEIQVVIENKDYFNQAILLSANWHSLKNEKNKNLITYEQYNITLSRINNTLLELIDSLPKESTSNSFDNLDSSDQKNIEIKLNTPIENFSFDNKGKLKKQLAKILKLDPSQLVIIKIINGSTIVRISLPSEKAFLLYKIFNSKGGKYSLIFKRLKIVQVKFMFNSVADYFFFFENRIKEIISFKVFIRILIVLVLLVSLFVFGRNNQKNSVSYLKSELLKESITLKAEVADVNRSIDESKKASITANEFFKEFQKRISDSLDIPNEMYATAKIKIQNLNVNIEDLGKELKDIELVTLEFIETSKKVMNQVPRTAKNQIIIESTRKSRNKLKVDLEKIFQKYEIIKMYSELMLTLVKKLEDNKNREDLKPLLIASNTLTKNLNLIKEINIEIN